MKARGWILAFAHRRQLKEILRRRGLKVTSQKPCALSSRARQWSSRDLIAGSISLGCQRFYRFRGQAAQ